MADRIQLRRDTKANWESYNPILLEGEPGHVLDDPNLYKMGDGVHAWNDLPYRGYDGTVVQTIERGVINSVPSADIVFRAIMQKSIGHHAYKICEITQNSSAGNITFSRNSDDKRVATVNAEGNTVNFFFGYTTSGTGVTFKANKHYKFIALFKNNGYSNPSRLSGLIRVYALGGAQILSQTFNPKFDGDYITLEYDYIAASDFSIYWFCLYQASNNTVVQGASLTYLDMAVVDLDEDKDSLDGEIAKQINERVESNVTSGQTYKFPSSAAVYNAIHEQDSKLVGFPITNNVYLNQCIKEMYVPKNIDLSNAGRFRFYCGWNGHYGFAFYTSDWTSIFDIEIDYTSIDNAPTIFTNNDNTIFAVLNWTKIQEQCGTAKYRDYDLTTGIAFNYAFIQNIDYCPTIKQLNSGTNIIAYNNQKAIISDSIYQSLFGSVSKDYYDKNQIANNSSLENIIFGKDSNDKLVATVSTTGNIQNFFFGFRMNNGAGYLKANKKYKLMALFKNDGFYDSSIIETFKNRSRGVLQVYAYNGARLDQRVFDVKKVTLDYILIEQEIQYELDFQVTWFCYYTPYEFEVQAGAKLTYLDLCIIDTDIEKEDDLDGVICKRIKEISTEKIKELVDLDGLKYTLTTLEIYPDGNPLQLTNLIRSITDNSSTNRYKIIVHNGEYEETDIVTKDYVDVEGEEYSNTILYCDGDATYNAPDDYSLGDQYSGMPLNEIPWNRKHLILHMSNSTVKNITLKTVGGATKYICHQDGNSRAFGTAVFEHCNFLDGGSTQVIGIGASGGQYYVYRDCQFVTYKRANLNVSCFNLHNWTNQSSPCGLRVENCTFIHTGIIYISELGSGQSDYWEFINCEADDPKRAYIVVTGNEDNMSYSMISRVVGGNMKVVQSDTRKNAKFTIQGQNIAIDHNTDGAVYGNALRKDGYIAQNANDGFYFALSNLINDSSATSLQTVNTFDIGFGLCVADNYAVGDGVYINNGKFTKTANGNPAGTVLQAKELSEEGCVLIRKIN